MKTTLAVSAIVHVIFLAVVIAPAFQGRGAGAIDIINVSLLGGGGGSPAAAAAQPAVTAEKEPEAKETPSKMSYKPPAEAKSAKKEKPKPSKSGASSSKTAAGQKGSASGTGSGTGTGTGPGSGKGIKLDDESFRFAYYLEVIRERIGYTWAPPVLFGAKSNVVATVYFKIGRDGSISDEKVEISSDQEIFDRAALRAVRLADPLPPLPAGFKGKHLGVHFEFEHTPG